MARRISAASLAGFRTLCNLGTPADLSDGRLIERFLAADGETRELAFRALVDRHGPMVVRACRSVLKDEHEAQDVAQEVFLTLARRAATLRRREAIGPWLHRVSLRAAVRSRRESARRAEFGRALAGAAPVGARPRPFDDAAGILHEEIDRLPRRSREAVVACDLEGLAYAAAAARLGLPVRTFQSRLHRGRARLKLALIRRGVGLGLADLVLRSRVEAAPVSAWAHGIARRAGGELALPSAVAWLARCAAVLVAGVVIAGAGSLSAVATARSAVQEPESKPKPASPPTATAALLAPLDREEARRVLRQASLEMLATARPANDNSRAWGRVDGLAIDALVSAHMKAEAAAGARETLEAAEKVVIAQATGRRQPVEAPDASDFTSLVQLSLTAQKSGFLEHSRRLIDEAIARFGPDLEGKADYALAPSADPDGASGNPVAWRSPLPISDLPTAVQLLRGQGRPEQAVRLARRAQEIVYPSLKLKSRDREAACVGTALRIAAAAIIAGIHDDLDDAIREAGLLPEDRTKLLGEVVSKACLVDVGAGRRFLPLVRKELAASGPKRKVLIFLLAIAGRVDEAIAMLRDIRKADDQQDARSPLDSELTAQMLGMIGSNQAFAGDRDGAMATLRLAVVGVLDRHPHRPAIRTIEHLANLQANLGDNEGAESTIAVIPRGDRTPSLSLKIARGFAIEGREERVANLLESARSNWCAPPADLDQLLSEDAPAAWMALEPVIHQFAYLARVDEALALVRDFADERERRVGYARVVRIIAERGEFARALQLAKAGSARDGSTLSYMDLSDGIRWRLEAEGRVNR